MNRSDPHRWCRHQSSGHFPIGLTLPVFCVALALTLPPCAAADEAAAEPAAAPATFAYTMTTEPSGPEAGSGFVLVFRIENLSKASLGATGLGPGFALETSLVKPWYDAATGKGGTELRLELRVLPAGPWRIESIELAGKEGRLAIGPLAFKLRQPSGEAPGESAARPSGALWSWKAPASAYRYSSFIVSLVGPPEAALTAPPLVPTPPGAAFEAVEGDILSWVITPLDGRRISLPEVRLAAGKLSGRAVASRIEVLPLPPAIAATRAQGEFELSFVGPAPSTAHAGDLLVFRLSLSGRGNLPSIRFPAFVATLDGRPLPSALLRESRSDSARPLAGEAGAELTSNGYVGAAHLEISLEAPGPGTLRIQPEAFSVLPPSGVPETLSAAAISIRILPRPSDGGRGRDEALLSLLPGLAEGLAKSNPTLSPLPRLVRSSKTGAALDLLAKAPPAALATTDARLLGAGLSWMRGERGKGLAALFGLSRQNPRDGHLRALAETMAAAVGAAPPLRDSLPPPPLFALPACALLLGGGGLLVGRFFRGRRRGAKRGDGGLLGLGAVLLALGLLLAGLALASGIERHKVFAVVWTDRIWSVPSPLAEGTEAIIKGSSAVVIGKAPGYVGLRFEDGIVGWATEEVVYSY